MKAIGLLIVLLGFAAFWLIGIEGVTLEDFEQELANWLHLPVAGKKPGTPVSTHPRGPVIVNEPIKGQSGL